MAQQPWLENDCLLADIVLLLRAFCLQLRYNPYSYNTIIYMGFSLFLTAVLLMQIYLVRQLIRFPEEYGAAAIVNILQGSAKNYMIFSFPFLFVFSAALCVSNVSLIRHEGFRAVNALGILWSEAWCFSSCSITLCQAARQRLCSTI